ncbi:MULTISPECIES: TetR/AcrR family transcriptional regulator C-terminal domain-containing protein [Streptomyces]|uniref:TetR/AcrR family transcriptional regulator C-terminal domain-containing protein n=1 Tax=Streptomyces TaxID=1883 RepID=UPI000B0C4506|nr:MULTISPECIES: TetR/AcrR family transcriptional regulator C-terminal domain-containing protein [Streptomyces]
MSPEKKTQQRKRPAPKQNRTAARLDREQVAAAGLRLLNETGLEGLTLRRIATELNVQAPALYWHFANKQALLDEMATRMTAELYDDTPDWPEDAGWEEGLTTHLRALRRTLLRYRDGAKVYSGTRLTNTRHGEGQERYLRRMVDAGFTPSAAARAFFVGYSYTVGFVVEEQGVHPMPGEQTPGFDLAERAERMAAYPLAAQIGADLFADWDTRFEEGLTVLVAGLRQTVLADGS